MNRWLSASEAIAALQVKPQTLYANVSRGRIRAKPDPKDSRQSLYHGADVMRLSGRSAGRRSAATVAAETIRWGDPVLSSGITAVERGRLFYRGRDAVRWSGHATFEQTCALLWEVESVAFADPSAVASRPGAAPLERALRALAPRVGNDPPCTGRSRGVLTAEAAGLLAAVVSALLAVRRGDSAAPLHLRLATAWSAPRAAEPLRRSLVLLADHELNASTFAARVAISTGAPLSAALIAGLATLAGPQHGGASAALQALVDAARRTKPSTAIRDWVAQGRLLPGFGHPLYQDGDPRAAALLQCFKPRAAYRDLGAEVAALIGEQPNIDFALAAMADALRLPPEAPFVTFAIARCAGWIAHALEQVASGELIRPRARYVGVAPAS